MHARTGKCIGAKHHKCHRMITEWTTILRPQTPSDESNALPSLHSHTPGMLSWILQLAAAATAAEATRLRWASTSKGARRTIPPAAGSVVAVIRYESTSRAACLPSLMPLYGISRVQSSKNHNDLPYDERLSTTTVTGGKDSRCRSAILARRSFDVLASILFDLIA